MSNKALDIKISDKDLKDLVRRLDHIKDTLSPGRANSKINQIVFQATKPMVQHMKSGSPIDETKVLKKSVGRWKTKAGVRVGARYRKKDKNKGWYVHLATYPHKTRGGGMTKTSTPFLADAFSATKNIVGKLIIEGVKKFVKW
tara:strand:- start:14 stop:442 length:429 start_codon:yes stop_codon:yes gene_type:complete